MHVNVLNQHDMKTRKLMLQISDTEEVQSIRPAREGLSHFWETGEIRPLPSENVAYQKHIKSQYPPPVSGAMLTRLVLPNFSQLLRPVARVADRYRQCSFIQSAVDADDRCSQIARNFCIWVGSHDGLLHGSGTMAAISAQIAIDPERSPPTRIGIFRSENYRQRKTCRKATFQCYQHFRN